MGPFFGTPTCPQVIIARFLWLVRGFARARDCAAARERVLTIRLHGMAAAARVARIKAFACIVLGVRRFCEFRPTIVCPCTLWRPFPAIISTEERSCNYGTVSVDIILPLPTTRPLYFTHLASRAFASRLRFPRRSYLGVRMMLHNATQDMLGAPQRTMMLQRSAVRIRSKRARRVLGRCFRRSRVRLQNNAV